MRTNVTFDGVSLQDANYTIKEISHESMNNKMLNVQSYSIESGGKITSVDFETRTITINGMIKGSSKQDLEDKVDTLKKNINKTEKDLDIEYESGTRRYSATGRLVSLERKYYTIDVIEFEAQFLVAHPPFGKDIDTTTLEGTGLTNTFAGTTSTGEHDGFVDFGGTVTPTPYITITFNSALGCRGVILEVTNEDGDESKTRINKTHFEDNDVVLINLEEGEIQINGEDVDYLYGFPKFSLANNTYTLSIVGTSYNVDIKFIYTKFWL